IGGPYFGKVNEVSSNDQTTYLPESAEATQVQELQGEFTDADGIPAIPVFVSDSEVTETQLDDISESIEALADIQGVEDEVSPPIPSEDGLAVQAFVPIDAEADTGDVVAEVSDQLASSVPAGIDVYVTGPAGLNADLTAAFAGID